MKKLLKKIASLHFDGDTRKGKRQKFIFDELAKRGCSPYIDPYGNIWVEKGSGKPLLLFSAHMDVDPRIRKKDMKSSSFGSKRLACGVLDNAVGCTLGILLAQRGPKKGRAIYVFTASEEASKRNSSVFARSAKEIVRQLRKRGLSPKACIVIDITYPRLMVPHDKIDWNLPDDEIFHMIDATHCYLDGYINRKSKRYGALLVRKFGNKKVRVRNLPGYDEVAVYGKHFTSFAFGPVVFGSFDQPAQTMPYSHMKTAFAFLKFAADECAKR
jgi:putative aminopeptidase FrvX